VQLTIIDKVSAQEDGIRSSQKHARGAKTAHAKPSAARPAPSEDSSRVLDADMLVFERFLGVPLQGSGKATVMQMAAPTHTRVPRFNKYV
jgi:hypothetical protein